MTVMLRFNVVLVGDDGAGKTSLIIRMAHGTFPDVYVPAVLDGKSAKIDLDECVVELSFHDTMRGCDPPLEELRHFSMQAVKADVVLLCFRIDHPWALERESLDRYLLQIKRYLGDDVPFLLVGLKTDLRSDERVLQELKITEGQPVSEEIAFIVSRGIGARGYVECSAKMAWGVEDVMKEIARVAMEGGEKKREERGGPCAIL